MCGTLGASDAGKNAVLMGWVNKRRDHGSLLFIDLRDRAGITQVVVNADRNAAIHEKAETLRNEYVIAAIGTVKLRDANTVNPNMPTGEVELVADDIRILNESKLPPFLPSDTALTNEETRLKYRYIDLRRDVMQFNIETRHNVAKAIRDYLSSQGFYEIETPFMTRSTPEGARDYLVPSRVHPGSFYALPQSPQIFKQILMISGFDRYFQIARCFRDEDLRADRQPEFTQIDLEMTFPRQETVFKVVEGFLRAAFAAAGVELPAESFVQMTYDQAIQKYGIDKPDMRLPAMVDLTAHLTPELRETLKIDPTLPVYGFTIPKAGNLSGTARKALIKEIQTGFGECGLDFLDVARLRTNEAFVPLAEAIAAKLTAEQIVFCGENFTTDDLAVVVTPKPGTPAAWNYDKQWIPKRVGALRLELAKKFADKHGLFAQTGTAKDFRFLWVTDFPMYEWNEETKQWDAAHHPFTSPHEEDIKSGALWNDKGSVRALAYDVVLNGTELGSGSIRIHRKDVQSEIFRTLGMTDEEAHQRFGFFLDALEYGTPPHGGIALGLDRIVMILAGASSLREVIAFPKTAKAIDLMVDAPTPVSELQLRELNLRIAHRS